MSGAEHGALYQVLVWIGAGVSLVRWIVRVVEKRGK